MYTTLIKIYHTVYIERCISMLNGKSLSGAATITCNQAVDDTGNIDH